MTEQQDNLTTVLQEPLKAMIRKDIRAALATMTEAEARYLVDVYYQIQENRKAAGNQTRAAGEGKEPAVFISWVFNSMEAIEETIKKALDEYTNTKKVCVWAKSITGIGPVIAAGLYAHIDITKAPTVGHIWRFAGQDPTDKWEKGQKRPWDAGLKTLCWKIGESFVKVCNNKNDFYGKLYLKRKQQEWTKNLAGEFSKQAAEELQKKNFEKDKYTRKWYEGKFNPATVKQYLAEEKNMLTLPVDENGNGIPMLPPAHIHARAKRYAVKLFLAHWHHVHYKVHFNADPPKPYVIAHMGHVDYIAPPNFS